MTLKNEAIYLFLKIFFTFILSIALSRGAFESGLVGWVLHTESGFWVYQWATDSLDINGCESSEDFVITAVAVTTLTVSIVVCWLLSRYISEKRSSRLQAKTQ